MDATSLLRAYAMNSERGDTSSSTKPAASRRVNQKWPYFSRARACHHIQWDETLLAREHAVGPPNLAELLAARTKPTGAEASTQHAARQNQEAQRARG